MEMHLFGLGWVFNWGGWAAVVAWWLVWGAITGMFAHYANSFKTKNWRDVGLPVLGTLFWLCNGGVSAWYEMLPVGLAALSAMMFVVLFGLWLLMQGNISSPVSLDRGATRAQAVLWFVFSAALGFLTIATLLAGVYAGTYPLLSQHDKSVRWLNDCARTFNERSAKSEQEHLGRLPALDEPYYTAICAVKAGDKEALKTFLAQSSSAPPEQLGRVAFLMGDNATAERYFRTGGQRFLALASKLRSGKVVGEDIEAARPYTTTPTEHIILTKAKALLKMELETARIVPFPTGYGSLE